MREKYIEECKLVQQNCTYTAEAHHQDAEVEKNKRFWLEVIPAICAALISTLIAAGVLSTDLLILTIISASVSAVAGIINPNKSYIEHLNAAKNFSALKHDARFLHSTDSARLSDEALILNVQRLHDQYNYLIKMVPPTSKKGFEKARKIIQGGIHEPDKDKRGKVK